MAASTARGGRAESTPYARARFRHVCVLATKPCGQTITSSARPDARTRCMHCNWPDWACARAAGHVTIPACLLSRPSPPAPPGLSGRARSLRTGLPAWRPTGATVSGAHTGARYAGRSRPGYGVCPCGCCEQAAAEGCLRKCSPLHGVEVTAWALGTAVLALHHTCDDMRGAACHAGRACACTHVCPVQSRAVPCSPVVW